MRFEKERGEWPVYRQPAPAASRGYHGMHGGPPPANLRCGRMTTDRNLLARRLFEGISDSYDRPAQMLSLGQYGRWRRYAVDRLQVADGALVLDVATGTGLVARDLVSRRAARVIGLDLTFAMLERARRSNIALVSGRAEQLPFPDASFDGIVFTYLLRYVNDAAATLEELVRVLRPGAAMASVEFGVPPNGVARAAWSSYALHLLPLAASVISSGWKEVGRFLGPSIMSFNERFPPRLLEDLWRGAGMQEVRTRRLTFGAGVVTWGTKVSAR